MKQPVFFSLCVTSYNRIKELERTLRSIDTRRRDDFEIVISEDCSPGREEIRRLVEQYAANAPYHVIFHSNPQNLGYDRNIHQLLELASGEYIMYLSDDDCLFPQQLDSLIDALETERPGVAYSAFWFGGCWEKKAARRKYSLSHRIPASEEEAGKRVYDSILFSGLVFRREYALAIAPTRFINTNFFQVYLFLDVLYRHGGYYHDSLLVDCVSDGENAFGNVASSGQRNDLLVDRDDPLSKLEFQKGLIKVIRLFDEDHQTQVLALFSKEYSLRSFTGLYVARKAGLGCMQEYWRRMKALGIHLSPVCYVYYVALALLGANLGRLLFSVPRQLIIKIRKYY